MITMNTTDQTLALLQSYMTPEYLAEHIDEFGSPKAFNIYAVGWAHAMDTPTSGPSRSPRTGAAHATAMVVHWPNGIQAKGEVRNQFHHVIDVAPTVLEAAGLPQPVMVNGVQQKPYEGVSMSYSFDDPQAPDRHETQYFEMYVNRGIYHKGWTAVTKHSTPWPTPGGLNLPAYDDDKWELYGHQRLDASP